MKSVCVSITLKRLHGRAPGLPPAGGERAVGDVVPLILRLVGAGRQPGVEMGARDVGRDLWFTRCAAYVR